MQLRCGRSAVEKVCVRTASGSDRNLPRASDKIDATVSSFQTDCMIRSLPLAVLTLLGCRVKNEHANAFDSTYPLTQFRCRTLRLRRILCAGYRRDKPHLFTDESRR